MLRQTLAKGETSPPALRFIQCSWKLESSTMRTSKASGMRTASSTGTPMLPTAATRAPEAAMRCSVSCTVVVLPLVPVTQIHSAARTLSRTRQASSMSPQTGMPRLSAQATIG